MTTSIKTITRKIGLNKGKRRIWLEGKVLTNAGINHGDRFDIAYGYNQLAININPAGSRKISGKIGREVIDMTAATITDAFADHIAAVTVKQTETGLLLIGIE